MKKLKRITINFWKGLVCKMWYHSSQFQLLSILLAKARRFSCRMIISPKSTKLENNNLLFPNKLCSRINPQKFGQKCRANHLSQSHFYSDNSSFLEVIILWTIWACPISCLWITKCSFRAWCFQILHAGCLPIWLTILLQNTQIKKKKGWLVNSLNKRNSRMVPKSRSLQVNP